MSKKRKCDKGWNKHSQDGWTKVEKRGNNDHKKWVSEDVTLGGCMSDAWHEYKKWVDVKTCPSVDLTTLERAETRQRIRCNEDLHRAYERYSKVVKTKRFRFLADWCLFPLRLERSN